MRNFFPHKSSNISDKNAISPLEDYKFSFLNANRALNLQFSSPHFFFCFFLFSFFSFLYLRRSAFTQINAYYVPECLLNSVTQPVWFLTSDSIKLRWGGGGSIIRLCAINFDKNEGPFLSTKWGDNEVFERRREQKYEKEEGKWRNLVNKNWEWDVIRILFESINWNFAMIRIEWYFEYKLRCKF